MGEGIAQNLAGTRAIARVLETCANCRTHAVREKTKGTSAPLSVVPHEIFVVKMYKSERKTLHSPIRQKKKSFE